MRRATLDDKLRVVEILSESFQDNQSVNYVVKQDNRKEDRIRKLMEYSFNVCSAFGEVWIDDEDLACALILLPDKKQTSIVSILWDVNLALSVIGLSRITSVMKRESMIKSHHPKESFCYLWFIGVDPLHQNKGIGSAFMEEIIHLRNQDNRPIYLETSVERNLAWYKKFGFEIFHSLNLSYTLYMLRRQRH